MFDQDGDKFNRIFYFEFDDYFLRMLIRDD